MEDKLIANGFKKHDGYKFKEFNIQDTYGVAKGTIVCFKCSKGLRCDKHELEKKNRLLHDEQFKVQKK